MLEGLMADHGEVEYATAEGNDVPAHEATYEDFTHFAVIGTVFVVTILVGLACGGVLATSAARWSSPSWTPTATTRR
jgi:hypothetical protein